MSNVCCVMLGSQTLNYDDVDELIININTTAIQGLWIVMHIAAMFKNTKSTVSLAGE